MTQDQLERLLTDWGSKVDVAAQNLMDLQALPAFQRLTGADGKIPPCLTGITAARVTPALEAMNELGQHFGMLVGVLQEAKSQMAQLPRIFGAEQKLREIEQLLTGLSIQLPPVHTPLAVRELCSNTASANRTSPQRLLSVMTQAFQLARDAVLAVDDAWQKLEWTVNSLEAESRTLEKRTGPLAVLNTVRDRLVAFRRRIECDPLGVVDDVRQEVEPLLSQVKANLERVERQRSAIQSAFTEGRKLLDRLAALRLESAEAYAAAREKIAAPSGLKEPVAEQQVVALRQWLTTLESRFADAPADAIEVGLRHWQTQAVPMAEAEQRAVLGNRAPLEARSELRGRLDALKAKALAKGRAEDQVLSDLGDQARAALFTRPTELDRAIELVTLYERRLNGKR